MTTQTESKITPKKEGRIQQWLTGGAMRIDLAHARKTYGKSIHFIPLEMQMPLETETWTPLTELVDVQVIHEPVFQGQQYDGARIAFCDQMVADTCQLVQVMASKCINDINEPWLSQRIKQQGVRCSFIQTMSKTGSLPVPIIRANLRFKKQGERIAPGTKCDSRIVLEDKSEPEVHYSDVNDYIKPGTKAKVLLNIGTVVLSSVGLTLRCEVVAMHLTGIAPQQRQEIPKDILEELMH